MPQAEHAKHHRRQPDKNPTINSRAGTPGRQSNSRQHCEATSERRTCNRTANDRRQTHQRKEGRQSAGTALDTNQQLATAVTTVTRLLGLATPTPVDILNKQHYRRRPRPEERRQNDKDKDGKAERSAIANTCSKNISQPVATQQRPLRWNQAAQEPTIRRRTSRRTTTATHQPNLEGIIRARRDTKTTTSQRYSTTNTSTSMDDGTTISATNAERRTRHNTCTSSLFICHLQAPPQHIATRKYHNRQRNTKNTDLTLRTPSPCELHHK
jgi:hypothetical protein